MRFVHGMEMTILGALSGAASATGSRSRVQTRTHVIRQTSRGSLDRLIAALRSEKARADRLEVENADLRDRLAAANRATLALLRETA